MEVEVRKIKDTESTPRSSIKLRLYDARMKNTHNLATEQNFKEQLRKIDPNMGLAQMANELTDQAGAG